MVRKGKNMAIESIGEIVNDKSMKSMKISSKRNLNEINDKSMKRVSPKVSYTEHTADKLVNIYKAPHARLFFLKCAWHLPEDTIWSAVESSRKKCVDNPLGLFIFLCNNALKELPVKN